VVFHLPKSASEHQVVEQGLDRLVIRQT
jgi:hypothetical protein